MKKLLTLSLLALMCANVFAQQVVLVFTGRDATTNAYVQLSRVEITDLTQGWTETITWPDTILTMVSGVGIAENGINGAFSLSQNNPNPFNGTTNVMLNVVEDGSVTIEVTDVNGRVVEAQNFAYLQSGTHQFRISVANTGTYVLTARQNGKATSVKMVNNGNGTSNAIDYQGMPNEAFQLKNGAKYNTNNPFTFGDQMEYVGYATVNGNEEESARITQQQGASQLFVLQFASVIVGQPCPGTPTLTDVDGNTYNTVLIGNQCWMKENLRTKKYADNTPIQQGTTTSYDVAYWYYPNDDVSNQATYGLLYNWKAVMRNSSSSSSNPSNVQGICPNGWHVPSDAEWTQLTDYVSSYSEYCCSSNTTYIAKALASTTGWDSFSGTCCVGNTPNTNNATGFSALPAGYYYGRYFNFGVVASYWSATEYISSGAYGCCLYYYGTGVYRNDDTKNFGFSVRCVRDESTVTLPTVTTNAVSSITGNSATCGGNVTSDGGATVTARGVCWSTSQNPTIADSHTTDGSGTGSFTSSITGLTAGTPYYVRAYATNSTGTAYGEQQMSFTTTDSGSFTCGTSTLTDVDGNTYNTVQIGNQCWMKENLRTKKYADNTSIQQGTTTSYDVAYWYYPNDDVSNQATYGLLYNWKAVMCNSSSSSSNPSNVQGICPNGWHVPSEAEWTQLTDYVSSYSEYCCSSNTAYIAKALASTTGWWCGSTITCAVGNTPSSNNATGFGAMPAGSCAGSYYDFGFFASYWSATEGDSSHAYSRTLGCNAVFVSRYNDLKYFGYSVRCVRD